MCVFIKWFAGSEIPVCTGEGTVGTPRAARKSSGTVSCSQERPSRRPVLKSSTSKVADQPRSSTSTIPTALVASRYLWQLCVCRGGEGGVCRLGGASERSRQTRREKEKGESEEQVPWERVPVLHSTESPPACQWEDSPAAAAASELEGAAPEAPPPLHRRNNIFTLPPPHPPPLPRRALDRFFLQYWNV